MKKKSQAKKNCMLSMLFIVFVCSNIFAQSHRDYTRESEDFYKKQQFDVATSLAIKALMIKPDFGRAQEALTLSLPACIRDIENKISRFKESNVTFQGDNSVTEWETVVKLYDFLVKKRDEIQNLPPVMGKKDTKIDFPIPDFYPSLREAKATSLKMKESAAEQHYNVGVTLMKSGTQKDSKLSAKEFKNSLSFVADFKDAANLYDLARKNAIMRIAIIPFENKSRKNQYGEIGEIITDKIVSDLMNENSAMEFIEIITRDQLEKVLREQNLSGAGLVNDNSVVQVGKLLGVSQILTGQITQISSSENPPILSSYIEEGTINPYTNQAQKVTARVSTNKKEAKASISGGYKIIDVKTGKLVKSDSFTENYEYSHVFARYEGPKEALSEASKVLCRREEENPPSDEERVNAAAKTLSLSFVQKLISFFK